MYIIMQWSGQIQAYSCVPRPQGWLWICSSLWIRLSRDSGALLCHEHHGQAQSRSRDCTQIPCIYILAMTDLGSAVYIYELFFCSDQNHSLMLCSTIIIIIIIIIEMLMEIILNFLLWRSCTSIIEIGRSWAHTSLARRPAPPAF